MRKKPSRAVALLIIFMAALILFNLTGSSTGTVDASEKMSEATLAVVCFKSGDTKINELCGYTSQMDVRSVRGNITPIGEDLKLDMEIDTYGSKVNGISYILESTDASRLLENTTVENYEENGDVISAQLQFENILDEGTEYLLVVDLDTESGDVYYYTRIMMKEDTNITDIIDFAMMFHDTTFSGGDGSEIATYIEPASGAANNDLSYVDIYASLTQIMWASYRPEIVSDVMVYVNEMNESYGCVTISYTAMMTEDDGDEKYFSVDEYYRVRISSERAYLLDYERQMQQYFTYKGSVYSKTNVLLGIRDDDVEYASNEGGSVVAFVQNGELWSYNEESGEVVKVYSYIDDYTDRRDVFGEHDIKILSMDESGSIEFVLYGYCNRGDHEGSVGVGVYRYDSITATVEEETFVASDKSYDVLVGQLSGLLYVSSDNDFYILVDGTLYCVDLNSQTSSVLLEGLSEGSYVVSDDSKYIAYINAKANGGADEITILNLNTEETMTIEAQNGTMLKPLYYLGEDLVYGIAYEENISEDEAGNITFPMHCLKIVDENFDEIKNYEPDGYYVVSVYESDDALHLVRVKHKNGSWVSAFEDTIINYNDSDSEMAYLSSTYTEDAQQTQQVIVLSDSISDESPRVITAELQLVENAAEHEFLQKSMSDDYYMVYRKGHAIYAGYSVADAIQVADENAAVVVAADTTYVWTRVKAVSADISADIEVPSSAAGQSDVARCIDAMLSYEEISNNAETYLSSGKSIFDTISLVMTEKRVLELSGVTLDEALYYVSNGTPVLSMDEDKNAVLIVGYDSSNVYFYYPDSESVEKMTLSEGEESISAGGNLFMGYLD